jgi:Xaa-Pro dipeptidase
MIDLVQVREAVTELGLDGWLIFDFHGLNPVASRLFGLTGLNTRRLFVLFPREGTPVAIVHKIELQGMEGFPGQVIPYARWSELHEALGRIVAGQTLAMEISPEDAVPYLDRVPFGVVELLRRLGAIVVPSGPLVSRFSASWSAAEASDHRFAAEVLATVAREALTWAVGAGGAGLTEGAMQARVISEVERRGLVFNEPPVVAFGPNSAMPHYQSNPANDVSLKKGDVILLDLWAGRTRSTVFADQTWMGFFGSQPPAKVLDVWNAVRRARDSAIEIIRVSTNQGRPIAGFEADRAARNVIENAGYGQAFVHRTGHSIDKDLHGSGPHLDDYETHDDRRLMPGVGFSVEPGVYLSGEFGVRSEVNVFMGQDGPEVTPQTPQTELIRGPA